MIWRNLRCLDLLLELAYPCLKYAIPFCLINTPQNLLQALKKLIFVGHLNPFEFFLHWSKQMEVTGGQIM
jgi:hypothetical protein